MYSGTGEKNQSLGFLDSDARPFRIEGAPPGNHRQTSVSANAGVNGLRNDQSGRLSTTDLTPQSDSGDFNQSNTDSTPPQTPFGADAHLGQNTSSTNSSSGHRLGGFGDLVSQDQRRNPRRTSIADVNSTAPPTLRRHDEKHQTFVSNLLVVAAALVTSIWPTSNATPRSTTAFSHAVLPLRTFIQETLRRSKTSYSTLQVALYYLILLKPHLPDNDLTREQPRESEIEEVDDQGSSPTGVFCSTSHPAVQHTSTASGCRVMQCGRRMFLSALMLASKYLQDRNYSTRAWSKISGLTCAEINKNERLFLGQIEYSLHIRKECFDNWSQIMMKLSDSKRHGSAPGLCIDSLSPSKLKDALIPELLEDQNKTRDFLSTIEAGALNKYEDSSIARPPSPPSALERLKSYQTATQRPFQPPHSMPTVYIGSGGSPPYSTTSSESGSSPIQEARLGTGLCVPSKPLPDFLPTPSGTPTSFASSPVTETLQKSSWPYVSGFSSQCDARGPAANLQRCPPPQPCYERPNMTGRADNVSPPWTSSRRSVTSSSTSPDSVFSDNASFTTRSRSSSISSTSSWESANIRKFKLDCNIAPQPSPLGKTCTYGTYDADSDCMEVDESTPPTSQHHRSSKKFQTMYVATSHENVAHATELSPVSPTTAANVLLMLSHGTMQYEDMATSREGSQSASVGSKRRCARKPGCVVPSKMHKQAHKREAGLEETQLQEHVARLVRIHNADLDALAEDSHTSVSYLPQRERFRALQHSRPVVEMPIGKGKEGPKEMHESSRPWASARRPLPVAGTKHSKRFAAAPTSCPADLAASFLRAEMVVEASA